MHTPADLVFTPRDGRQFLDAPPPAPRAQHPADLEVSAVRRRGLLGIEGLAVRACFDPKRSVQRPVLTAVNRCESQLLREVLDPLEGVGRLRQLSDGGIALHEGTLLPPDTLALFNRTPLQANGAYLHTGGLLPVKFAR